MPITVTADPSCGPWTATPSATWITLVDGSGTTGNSSTDYSVAANTGKVPLTGGINFSFPGAPTPVTLTYNIYQLAAAAPRTPPLPGPFRVDSRYSAGACAPEEPAPLCGNNGVGLGPYVLAPSPGTYLVQITGMGPSATTASVWVGAPGSSVGTLTELDSETTSANVGFAQGDELVLYVDSSTGPQNDPNAWIDLKVTHEVVACSVSQVAPPTFFVPGTGALDLTASFTSQPYCSWLVAQSSGLTLTSANSGVGTGSVTFSVGPDSGGSSISDVLTIIFADGTQFTWTVDQNPTSGCTYNANPSVQAVPASGGTETTAISSTPPGCWWTFGEDGVVVTAATGNNVNALSYTVSQTPGPARTGFVSVGDGTDPLMNVVTVNQSLTDPVPTGLSPTTVSPNGPSFMLTVNGTGFTSDGVVNWNGVPLATTYVNSSQLTAQVPANFLTGVATILVTVSEGGVNSGPIPFFVGPPPALILIPPSATAGGPGLTLTVTVMEAGFTPDAVVNWNDVGLPTTYVNATQLTAQVGQSLIATPGMSQITVVEATATFGPAPFNISPSPIPLQLDPQSATGGFGLTLTVGGTGFINGAVVNFNGIPLITAFESTTELIAQVPASDLLTLGSVPVTVTESGVTSTAIPFVVLPSPTPISLSPSTISEMGPSFSLIVNGTAFTPLSVVDWNGIALFTTYQNSTQLTAQVPANLIAAPEVVKVTVSANGEPSSPLPFTVAATLTIGQLSPASAAAGSPAFQLTVNGTDFVQGAVVVWNAITPLVTTFQSSTQLTAQVPTALIGTSGTPSIAVSQSNVFSNAITFTIVNGPAPTMLSPATASAGGAPFMLTVTGTGFVSGDVVNWNGGALMTTYQSATQLTAQVPAALIAMSGTVPVTVTAGKQPSAPLSFNVVVGQALTMLAPATATAGGPDFTLTLSGTGFTQGAYVNWNGQALITSFQSPTQLTAQVSAALIATSGSAQVTVSQSGAATAALTFNISVGPAVTMLSPATIALGGPDFTLTVTGTAFSQGAMVTLNGGPLRTTYLSPSQLSALVPAALTTTANTAQIAVSVNGVTSNAIPFNVVPGAAPSQLSPVSATSGGPDFMLTVTGTGFAQTAVVNFNGTALSTTYQSPTMLQAQVTAGLIASPGTAQVTVTENGLTSNPIPFAILQPPTLVSFVSSLNFVYKAGSAAPPSQPIAVGSSGLNFAFTATASSDQNWLIVTPPGGSTPGILAASVAQLNLAPGSYHGMVTVSSTAGNVPQLQVSATLTVTNNALLTPSPTLLSFAYLQGGTVPAPQTLSVFHNGGAASYTAAVTQGTGLVSITPAGTTPGTITVTPNVSSSSPPGPLAAQVTITPTDSTIAPVIVPITINVYPGFQAQPAQLGVTPDAVSVALTQGSSAVQRHLSISNDGGGTLQFSCQLAPVVTWLTVPACSTSVNAGQLSDLSLNLDPTGLTVGTFTTQLSIQAGSTISKVVVTLQVIAGVPTLVLSQSALEFTVIQGGTASAPQQFAVINSGSGTMDFQISCAAAPWLTCPTTNGTSPAGAANGQIIALSVTPQQGQTPGPYFASVMVSAATATNQARLISVVMNILPSGVQQSATVTPSALLLSPTLSGAAASGNVSINNLNGPATNFTSTIVGTGGAACPQFTSSPQAGPVPAFQLGASQVMVNANFSAITPGSLLTCVMTLGFDDGSSQSVQLVALAPSSLAADSTPQGTESSRTSRNRVKASGNCTPTSLVPVITSLQPNANYTVGDSIPITVAVNDNCGNPLTPSAESPDVFAGYLNPSNPPPPGSNYSDLQWQNGVWAGTWSPGSSGTWTVQVKATSSVEQAQIVGESQPVNETVALPNAISGSALINGVSSAATASYNFQVAPNSLISIYGDRLATATMGAAMLPLPTDIAQTEALLGPAGNLGLLFVNPMQVNALIPSNIAVNTQVDLVVKQGTTQSAPRTLTVVPFQPAVFMINTAGDAAVELFTPPNNYQVVKPSNPVHANDTIVIYCTGLGVAGGLTTSVTIGGSAASVLFAGDSGFLGLNQINATVPAGLTPGNLPIVITVTDQDNNSVSSAQFPNPPTIAVQ